MSENPNQEPLNYEAVQPEPAPHWTRQTAALVWMAVMFAIVAAPLCWLAWRFLWFIIGFHRTWGIGP